MRYGLVGALLAAALMAAGCGGGGGSAGGGAPNGEALKSGQAVLKDAVTAAKAASSVHVSGRIGALGQGIGLDMTLVKGKGSTGSITLGGQKVDLRVIGTDGYMKAGTAFWTQFGGSSGSTAAQMLHDKWVKFSTTNARFSQITSFTDATTFFDGLGSTTGTVSNKGATTYKGQNVVEIDNQGAFYVSNTGTAYPVAVVANGTGLSGTMSFDAWNKPVTLTAPSDAIDFPQLTG